MLFAVVAAAAGVTAAVRQVAAMAASRMRISISRVRLTDRSTFHRGFGRKTLRYPGLTGLVPLEPLPRLHQSKVKKLLGVPFERR